MKVSAINPAYSSRVQTKRLEKPIETTTNPGSNIPQGMTMISFKGGNKGDVLHVAAEIPPLCKEGGVATVANDYKTLNNISASEHGRTAIVIPYYNGAIEYDAESGKLIKGINVHTVPQNLPEGSPLKGQEGKPFYTKQNLDEKSLDELFKTGKDIIILEEVAEKKMQWGLIEDSPIKLFKVPSDKVGVPNNTDIYMVYTEGTASMSKPYKGGGYATSSKPYVKSWNGDPYAQFDKAVVELMSDINKKTPGFDPGTVICSDSHAAFVTHYMAKKNAAGDEYFKGKKPTQVGHNLGDGYIGKTFPQNMIVNLGATKEQLETLINSKEYVELLKNGDNEKTEEFLLKFLNQITGENKKIVSAMDIPVYYGLNGYLPKMSTVSEGYKDATLNNKEVAPSLYQNLAKLDKTGRYIGLTNSFSDTNFTAFEQIGIKGYGKDQKCKLADGTEFTVKAMEKFDKAKATDLNYVREIKRKNKINLLERFQDKFNGLQIYNDNGKPLSVKESENLLRAGLEAKNHKIYGGFSSEYIKKLQNGEDIKLATSWGRGDFQKALDSVVDGFEKFVNKTGDKNTLLLLGGDLQISPEEGEKVINKVKLLSQQEKFKGRIVLMDGFAPNAPLASSADICILPSRFAPCELTDLEAKRFLATPVVTNCQGLAQKNFDPDIASEASQADGFKTKHEYYMPESEALNAAQSQAKADFEAVKNKLVTEETTRFKLRTGKKLSDTELLKRLSENGDYQKALRTLRDSVISDELAETMERALIKYRTGEVAEKLLKNQVNMDTTWENNGWISRTKTSSAELYRREHINAQAKDIAEKDLLKLDFSELSSDGTGSTTGGQTSTTTETKNWFKRAWEKMGDKLGNKGRLATVIGAGAVIVGGTGYAIYNHNKKKQAAALETEEAVADSKAEVKAEVEKKEEGKHLSAVG